MYNLHMYRYYKELTHITNDKLFFYAFVCRVVGYLTLLFFHRLVFLAGGFGFGSCRLVSCQRNPQIIQRNRLNLSHARFLRVWMCEIKTFKGEKMKKTILLSVLGGALLAFLLGVAGLEEVLRIIAIILIIPTFFILRAYTRELVSITQQRYFNFVLYFGTVGLLPLLFISTILSLIALGFYIVAWAKTTEISKTHTAVE